REVLGRAFHRMVAEVVDQMVGRLQQASDVVAHQIDRSQERLLATEILQLRGPHAAAIDAILAASLAADDEARRVKPVALAEEDLFELRLESVVASLRLDVRAVDRVEAAESAIGRRAARDIARRTLLAAAQGEERQLTIATHHGIDAVETLQVVEEEGR